MKKRILAMILTAAMSLSMVGCSGNNKQTQGATPAAEGGNTPYVLKMNLAKGPNSPYYTIWDQFCKEVEERSEGTLKMELYASEALGNTVDMVEAAAKGAAVLQDCDPSHLADYVPDLSVFMHPYLFSKPEDIETLWKSELGGNMMEELEAQGLHVVTMVYFGTRHLISDKKIETRDDTKGMKLRCAPTKMWNEVINVLGGEATNTAWSEVYTALSQGVADGAESPVGILYDSKLQECVKHLSLTGHLIATSSIVMSEDVYQSLPDAAKKAIDEVGSEWPAINMDLVKDIEAEYTEKMLAEGVEVNEITDRDSFVEASKSVSNAFPEWTPGLYDSVMEVIAS